MSSAIPCKSGCDHPRNWWTDPVNLASSPIAAPPRRRCQCAVHVPSIVASLDSSLSQVVTTLCVHASSCMASKVRTIRTVCPLG